MAPISQDYSHEFATLSRIDELFDARKATHRVLVLLHMLGGKEGDGFQHLGTDFYSSSENWLSFFHLFAEEQHCGIQAAEDVHGIAVERDRIEGSLRSNLTLSCSFIGARVRVDVGIFIGNLVFWGDIWPLDDGHNDSDYDGSCGNGALD